MTQAFSKQQAELKRIENPHGRMELFSMWLPDERRDKTPVKWEWDPEREVGATCGEIGRDGLVEAGGGGRGGEEEDDGGGGGYEEG